MHRSLATYIQYNMQLGGTATVFKMATQQLPQTSPHLCHGQGHGNTSVCQNT